MTQPATYTPDTDELIRQTQEIRDRARSLAEQFERMARESKCVLELLKREERESRERSAPRPCAS